jgi:hypothetical protein
MLRRSLPIPRPLLSHTLAVYLCQQHGLAPLRFAQLLTT